MSREIYILERTFFMVFHLITCPNYVCNLPCGYLPGWETAKLSIGKITKLGKLFGIYSDSPMSGARWCCG
jgi:hypothetical protein